MAWLTCRHILIYAPLVVQTLRASLPLPLALTAFWLRALFLSTLIYFSAARCNSGCLFQEPSSLLRMLLQKGAPSCLTGTLAGTPHVVHRRHGRAASSTPDKMIRTDILHPSLFSSLNEGLTQRKHRRNEELRRTLWNKLPHLCWRKLNTGFSRTIHCSLLPRNRV